ncbi:hypothetical protein [Brevundimonas vesicularis]|uniref:Uncharacterized protein n=1 Tax=Brevundimonas vesicularis TaxID=41276 RepID=A0A1Z3U7X1_BREVE|nr:hypothetical protein [Brevundimonas vesicularis]ASE39353.1 hypothetical protein CEP68_07470 [Brevundimonas vesicularis]
MSIVKIGSKRTFETGSAVLPHGATEFEISVANFNPTIKIDANRTQHQVGTGLRPSIELLAPPSGSTDYFEKAFADGTASYTLALVVRSYGPASHRYYTLDYSVTT